MPVPEVVADHSRFKQYTRAKQTIAYEIRALAEFLRKHLGEREAEECRQLMVKLAEDRFALAVLGQFKRGKSSLMNAIIGRDLLPTGVLPLTSAITVVKYGPKERLTIIKDGALYPEEVPLSSLAEYVTEKGNPGNAKKVARAYLELPLLFLRRGLEFVDTPGIGSSIEANTATTYGFLPQSDAVIFVTSVDTPLTRTEIDFLQSIREHVRKIFFVLNKIDLVGDPERQEILHFASETLSRLMGVEAVRVFPVSSAMGLRSQLAGKPEGYDQSGVKALQEALSEFLSSEKSNMFLASVLDKALRVAAKASRQMSLFKVAAETSQGELQEKTAALGERFKRLRAVRGKLMLEIQERTVLWAIESISAVVDSFVADETGVLLGELDQAFSQARWELALGFTQDFVRQALPRLQQDLAGWIRKQIERIDPAFKEILRHEWPRVELQMQRIPAAAAEILGTAGAEASPREGSSDLPTQWVLTQPGFMKLAWKPKLPMLQAGLPVLVVRSRLRKRVSAELCDLMNMCVDGLRENAADAMREAMRRVQADIEARAAELESRILRGMMGQRVSKGIDGRWQVTELDTEEISWEIEILAGIERKLIAIRSDILEPQVASAVNRFPEALSERFSPPVQPEEQEPLIEVPAAPIAAADLAHDLGTRGCPVCERMIRTASRFFADWQYALASQEHAQRTNAASLGFCPLHTWQLAALASPQGLSQGYPSLMERLSADLSSLATVESISPEDMLALVQTSSRCRVCRLLKITEKAYLDDLSAFVQTLEGQKSYAHSQGLCLRHLGLLIAVLPSTGIVRFLLEQAARRFAEISEDMQSYVMKRHALRGNLQMDEQDAYLRGLIHSAGAREVCFPWDLDGEI